MYSRDMARGLAWFGIGLGLVELLASRDLARATGLQGHETLLQVYGLREIATGALILAAAEPERWLWGRRARGGTRRALRQPIVGLRVHHAYLRKVGGSTDFCIIAHSGLRMVSLRYSVAEPGIGVASPA